MILSIKLCKSLFATLANDSKVHPSLVVTSFSHCLSPTYYPTEQASLGHSAIVAVAVESRKASLPVRGVEIYSTVYSHSVNVQNIQT